MNELPAIATNRRRITGQETAARIVAAAYELLRSERFSAFSMRGIAKRAEVRLASVQYHFPTMEDLIRALIALNTRRYTDAYRTAVENRGDSARERLEAVIAFNLEDIQKSDTRRFFIRLWPLLESLDDFSGSLLTELYSAQFALLSERIRDAHPEIVPAEAKRRAELVAALIEGMFITLPPTKETRPQRNILRKRAIRLCMAIADGEGMTSG